MALEALVLGGMLLFLPVFLSGTVAVEADRDVVDTPVKSGIRYARLFFAGDRIKEANHDQDKNNKAQSAFHCMNFTILKAAHAYPVPCLSKKLSVR